MKEIEGGLNINRVHVSPFFHLIAHRGASFDAPENTLAAINLAWQRGADAVEVDVRMTKDFQIVVIHDATTRRTGTRSLRVSRSYLDKLETIDVGKWKNNRFKNEKIPLLKDVLCKISLESKLYVEIKEKPDIVPHLVRLIRDSGVKPRNLNLIGMNLLLMRQLKKDLPEFKMYWVHEMDYFPGRKVLKPGLGRLIRKAQKAGMDGLDVWAGSLVTPDFVKQVHAAGLKLLLWTVDDPQRAAEFVQMGVDGITTNRPAWMKEELVKMGAMP